MRGSRSKEGENLTFIEINEEHLEQLQEIYREIGEEEPLTREEAAEILGAIRNHPYYRVYLGLIEGRPVCTYSILIAPNLAQRGKSWAVVEGVVVIKDMQGCGLGREMMRHAMDQARNHGCYKLALSSNAKRIEAHEFYRNIGFTQHGYSFRVDLEEAHD